MIRWLTLSCLVFLFSAAFGTSAEAGRRQYSDTDWNVILLDNCGMPVPSARSGEPSVEWFAQAGDRKLKFVLDPGDVGRCSSDSRRRHGAPYWERAELRQLKMMSYDAPFEIRFSAQFLEGFTNGRETFFQLHGWTHACTAAPLVMLKSHHGSLRLELLQGVVENGSPLGGAPYRGQLRPVSMERLLIRDLVGAEHVFRSRLSMKGGYGVFSLWIDDRLMVDEVPFTYQSCVTPRIKLGIYRPGGDANRRSVLLIDDVWVRSGALDE
ncbi:hypothetical protein [Jannaschia sp. 2305UL9-9]|uniref:hypothetical protein n=1 Tax=Jannaschia sp. 2305UL9-9 TaxID=3121638 RepID=UPI0035296661